MNLDEAKVLFKKNHAEESQILEGGPQEYYNLAASVWFGFKSALLLTGKLNRK